MSRNVAKVASLFIITVLVSCQNKQNMFLDLGCLSPSHLQDDVQVPAGSLVAVNTSLEDTQRGDSTVLGVSDGLLYAAEVHDAIKILPVSVELSRANTVKYIKENDYYIALETNSL